MEEEQLIKRLEECKYIINSLRPQVNPQSGICLYQVVYNNRVVDKTFDGELNKQLVEIVRAHYEKELEKVRKELKDIL